MCVRVFIWSGTEWAGKKTDKWHSSNLYASHRIYFPHDLQSTKKIPNHAPLVWATSKQTRHALRIEAAVGRPLDHSVKKMKANLNVSRRRTKKIGLNSFYPTSRPTREKATTVQKLVHTRNAFVFGGVYFLQSHRKNILTRKVHIRVGIDG